MLVGGVVSLILTLTLLSTSNKNLIKHLALIVSGLLITISVIWIFISYLIKDVK